MDADYDRAVVREALELGRDERAEPTSGRVRIGARRSAIASPLIVDDLTMGVIYIDRPLTEGVFTDADAELLFALSGQASVALELTRALRARERSEESLRNADKMDAVARLARSIAHDLNNMLSAIRLATGGMLLAPKAKEILGDDIQTIQSALKRANELTRQLGTFSGGEFGKPQKVRLAPRIERLVPVMSGLLGENIVVETSIPKKVPPVFVDPNQLDQIVMNLVLNARDAMPNGGRIDISLSAVTFGEDSTWEAPQMPPGSYVRFVLSDTGCGMDEEVRRKVFEPYFTTKRGSGGTGLGLASVYWIVSQAGGHIEVASEVGRGASFTIYFPVDAGTQSRGPVESRSARTVLVVERDAASARELEDSLVELGYRVLVAAGGPQALDVVRKHADVALVMIDVALQGMNGLELAREIANVNDQVAVLLMSDTDTAAIAPSSGSARAANADFLRKPVSRHALAKRLELLLPRTAHQS
jgi:two-component system cell cycle sensor histidine kinase/response regulator CckA